MSIRYAGLAQLRVELPNFYNLTKSFKTLEPSLYSTRYGLR